MNLPSSVSIICAQVSAAHVSWAALSTFNAPPPYLIVSACSDGCLRFWKCESNTPDYSISDKVISNGKFNEETFKVKTGVRQGCLLTITSDIPNCGGLDYAAHHAWGAKRP
ncbi:unnamed protein product [Trichobilharzia regenti]|nr:unnamed protein product [Trichobilharzia regenti]